ncbi:MAG TPA: hypothetical protein VNN10_12630 [Dehalococcoidia bacterium]|nr:hypothetical protein [Dehalococcoidia bacterium]
MRRDREYAARLFLHWLNERYRRSFSPASFEGVAWTAEDEGGPEAPGGRIGLVVAPLSEASEAWERRCRELEARLDEARPGSYLLWVPPGARLPAEEPEESEWVRRVVLGASRLASGRKGEARLPVKMVLAKVRDEGGYANVIGGLGRHWTTVTEKVNGTFYLDSRNLHRLTRDEAERAELFDHIGLLSQGVKLGEAVEFEHEDAWSVQRLPRGAAGKGMADGWAIAGCPEGFDPFDGAVTRRLLRRNLIEAREALASLPGALRALVLIGAYDYMENEGAGPALRGFDPALAAALDIVVLVADTEVKPIVLSRSIPWLSPTRA